MMKKVAPIWKYLKYLFWLGPILLVMGLSAGVVSATWGPIPLGLVIAGIVIIGLWLILQSTLAPKSQSRWWSRRSAEAGTNAIISTLAILVILALVNFLGVRYAQRIDLTENQLLSLAPQTQEVVRNLTQPVKAWVFTKQPEPRVRTLLEQYQRQGRLFDFEFVDPETRPGLAQEFGVKDFGDLYLDVGPGKRRQYVQNVQSGVFSETQLTNALLRATSDRQSRVYFLQGHGERSLQSESGSIANALTALQDKNFAGEPINWAERPGIPEDADVVVVAGPRRALFEAEATALREFLNQGGGVLLLIDPQTEPGLNSLLKEWGVQLDNRLAIDASGSGQLVGLGPATPLVTRYGDHLITRDFGNGISFYPLARPVDITPVQGISATPLLITDDRSWAESDLENKDLQFDEASDRQGPLTLGVALSRAVTNAPVPSPTPTPSPTPPEEATEETPEAEATPSPSPEPSPIPEASPTPAPTPSPTGENAANQQESRLVVIGDSDFITNGLFEQQLNGDVFLNSVQWLSQQDQAAFSIRPKEPTNRRINMTPTQARLVGWTALAILPLIGFATAAILWWKRR